MDFGYSVEDERFRHEVRDWLERHLVGEFASLGTGAEFSAESWKLLVAWEQTLGRGGWIGLSWPRAHGGRDASPIEELVFAEEYARAHGPTRGGTFGEGLLGPTLIHFGTDDQRARFLPPILRGEEFWCQGFSEPGAGSDLAALSTRARLDGDDWVIDGQKVWTSQAQYADWIFVLCRTSSEGRKHDGLSFLLVPLDQPGIEIRPLVEMTGGDHFCEVFFDGARSTADMIVGAPGDGWRIAMATLGFERGTAFIGQLRRYADEWRRVRDVAIAAGLAADPLVRQRLADSYIGLEIMRYGAFRTVTNLVTHGRPGPEASIGKLQWSQWHQQLGEMAIDLLGAHGMLAGEHPSLQHDLQHTFLFSRAHTIYAGSSQVQRNIIGERVLGLPKEPAAA
jgi:alkylation response protein AidB-like acyl-CoA dehydrogenase